MFLGIQSESTFCRRNLSLCNKATAPSARSQREAWNNYFIGIVPPTTEINKFRIFFYETFNQLVER